MAAYRGHAWWETGRPADDQVGVPFLNPLFLYLAPKIWGNFVPSTLQL